jgi:hypothetical protein
MPVFFCARSIAKTIVLVALIDMLSTTNLARADTTPFTIESWANVVLAVQQANSDGGGIIRLATRSTMVVNKPLPIITGKVVIEGNGATLKATRDYHGALVRIAAAGSLELEDLFITGFDRKTLHEPVNYPSLIDNDGRLTLNRVTLADNPTCHPCTWSLTLLDNRGEAWLNNVTIFRNYTINPPPTANVRNCGFMQILNSTFANNEANYVAGLALVRTRVPAAIVASMDDSCSGGVFEIGNTLFDNVYANCGELGEVSDLGGNFESDGSCGFDSARNVANQPSGLGRFGLQGGLVPTVGLEPGSHAIDIGVNEICSAFDARLASRPTQTRVNIEPSCDAGAFEYGGGFGDALLSGNGMNGVWYNAATDGHYVHVIRVSPNRVYVNWTTFDQNADQLWILAVATTTDSASFTATAYRNTGGMLVPGGAPDGHTVEEWGEIELEFDDCSTGTFRYSANDPGFGDGAFELNRLAFDEGVGCTNN